MPYGKYVIIQNGVVKNKDDTIKDSFRLGLGEVVICGISMVL